MAEIKSSIDEAKIHCKLNQSPKHSEDSDVLMDVDDPKDEDVDIPRISLEGVDDANEEAMIMTVEEIKNYVSKKILEYAKDPSVNILLSHKNKIQEYQRQIQHKNEDLNKLSKVFEVLYRDQVKFLRHIGIMPRALTKTVGVGVDLPWTSETIGGVELKKEAAAPEKSVKNESMVKNVTKNQTGPVECIDLSSDEDDASSKPSTNPLPSAKPRSSSSSSGPIVSASVPASQATIKPKRPLTHPAPPPPAAVYLGHPSNIPMKPKLKISVESKGIVLQWSMPAEASVEPKNVKKYEIFGYQEKPDIPPSSSLWKKIGNVDAMKLPMSCTLTQFVEGYNYHFSIRAVGPPDISGPFSEPATVKFNSI